MALVCSAPASAQVLLLKDGRRLEGKFAELASISESTLASKTQAGEVPLTPLLVVDDGLRRTFIHTFQVKQVLDDKAGSDVRININWQPVAEKGTGVIVKRFFPNISKAIRVLIAEVKK